jgi:predicted anti-sigma-YlaC factor YlaD
MMNQETCDQYIEWMSLAQDGALNSTQTRLLHTHLAACPPCQTQWEAMTLVSQMFRAAPMVAPAAGFVDRFQIKMAYQQEQRRRTMIWLLLGIGVFALLALTLPSVIGLLSFTGRLILPYQVIAYVQGLWTWTSMVLSALTDAAWVLIRYGVTQPAGLACLGSGAAMGVLAIFVMRHLLSRRITQS